MQVQFITHATSRYTYAESALMALQGGCRWIQLRIKGATDEEVRPVALQIQRRCKEVNATFLIDDRVELAKTLHADGVHLGKNDMSPSEARTLLGPDSIIGGTANTTDDIDRLCAQGVDYIGCGPYRFTKTKANLSPLLGLEGYQHILHHMHAHSLHTPLIAIGGITYADLEPLLQVGIDGVALSGAILNAPQPVEEMKRIMDLATN